MNGMTHEEYVNIQRQEIIEIAKKIVKKDIDIIEGCRKISGIWFEAELPEDDSYNFFTLIDDDTDTFLRGYAREISSEEYLKEQDQKEKEYLERYEKDINEECQKLIDGYGK